MLTAESNVKPTANRDDAVGAKSNFQHTDPPLLNDATDAAAVNIEDDWEQDADELVSWTTTLDI